MRNKATAVNLKQMIIINANDEKIKNQETKKNMMENKRKDNKQMIMMQWVMKKRHISTTIYIFNAFIYALAVLNAKKSCVFRFYFMKWTH